LPFLARFFWPRLAGRKPVRQSACPYGVVVQDIIARVNDRSLAPDYDRAQKELDAKDASAG
jgi:hypothetical protein